MAADNVNMTGIVKVNSNSTLRVRNRPSIAGAVIANLENGTRLTITKKDGKWYYSTETGGWSHGDYLTLTNNETVQVSTMSQEEQDRIAKDLEEKRDNIKIAYSGRRKALSPSNFWKQSQSNFCNP